MQVFECSQRKPSGYEHYENMQSIYFERFTHRFCEHELLKNILRNEGELVAAVQQTLVNQ